MKNLNKKQKILFVSGLCTLFLFIIGATYAYFSVTVNNNSSNASLGGTTNDYGIVTLTTNTSKLYLRFTSDEMAEDKVGTVYYANSSSTGTPLTTDPNYTLATATLTGGVFPVEAEYSFKVLASSTKTITDTIAESIKVKIGETTLTLKELLAAGTTGLNVTGVVQDISEGNPKTIPIYVSVENLNSSQDDLSNNTFKITINPSDTASYRLLKVRRYVKPKVSFASELIDSGNLWQSGLEGDGYRYVGTTANNFICFGTTDVSECTTNPDKYMYRIIGVFADSSGNSHVKLIKYKQLLMQWFESSGTGNTWYVSFASTLLGSTFYTNSEFDYMQNDDWKNKITNWNFVGVSTNTESSSYDTPDYSQTSVNGVYIHENNITSSESLCTNINGELITCDKGTWHDYTSLVGLMYVSDYLLSIGNSSLSVSNVNNSASVFKASWMHQSNNDNTKSLKEWTIASYGILNSSTAYIYNNNNVSFIKLVPGKTGETKNAIAIADNGSIIHEDDDVTNGIRPVFYLNNSVTSSGGTGTITDPFIIQN